MNLNRAQIHESDTGTKEEPTESTLPKTVFDREAEPLGLSIASDIFGVALHKDGQLIVPPGGFPDDYAAEAGRLLKRFRKAWREDDAPDYFSRHAILRRVYEALGGIAYHIQFPDKSHRLQATTGNVVDYFLMPGIWGRNPHDPHDPRRANAPDWCLWAGLGPRGIRMFGKTAKRAANAAFAGDETDPAFREAFQWLALLHELASNPYRQKDAKVFADYCVRKIEERAGGSSE